MIAPPGFLTREHANRLLAAGETALAAIIERFHVRIAEVMATEPDTAKARALCEQAAASALAEIAQIDALTRERIGAGTEH